MAYEHILTGLTTIIDSNAAFLHLHLMLILEIIEKYISDPNKIISDE